MNSVFWYEVFHLLLLQFDYLSEFVFKLFVFISFSVSNLSNTNNPNICEVMSFNPTM